MDTEVDAVDGYVKMRLIDLKAATRYAYAFITDSGVWSESGRFQTAFAEGTVAPVLVGATACTASGRAPFPSLRHLAEQPLDVFCHLGGYEL